MGRPVSARPTWVAGLVVASSLALLGCAPSGETAAVKPAPAPTRQATTVAPCAMDSPALAARLEQLEGARGAVIGVQLLDTEAGATVAYRGDERFPFASTIKALAAAVVLDRLSEQELSRRLHWTEADLVPNSPVTKEHVASGMTVREVLEAAVKRSDNTAANVLVDLVGGPAALDQALERAGDDTTEVVRREPALNDYTPGDSRDTTTPHALASTLAAFAVGGELAAADQRLLNSLLVRNTTGDALIRSAVPEGWTVGDKTGTAGYGTRNDVAVITPPDRAPVVLPVLTRHQTADAAADDALVAEAARAALHAWCGRPSS